MQSYVKVMIAALTAAIALSLALSTASARTLSTSEREFEILFHPLTFEAAGNSISCPLTLLGNFIERTIPKSQTQTGRIKHVEPSTAAEPSPCTGGTLTILNETLPWALKYTSFTGRLPNITAVRVALTGTAFRVTPRGDVTCLAGTTVRNPAFGELLIGAGGRVEGLRADETISIPLSGGFLCSFASGRFSGTAGFLNLPRTASVTITLI